MYPVLAFPRKLILSSDGCRLILSHNGKSISTKINDTAFDILSLCNGYNTLNSIVNYLVDKYNEDHDNVVNIVSDFLDESSKLGTISYVKSSEDSNFNIKILGSKDYYVPLFLSLEVTYKCPLKCKHCYRNCSIEENSMIDINHVKKIASNMEVLGIMNVQITGGEPFIHSNISEIIEIFSKKNINITLITSGYIINDDIINTLSRFSKNIDNIQVSIDGLSNHHNFVRQSEDSYDRAIDFITKIKNIGIWVDVATTICNIEIDEVFKLSKFLKSIGVNRHRLGTIVDQGRASSNFDLKSNLTPSTLNDWISSINTDLKNEHFCVIANEDINYIDGHCGVGYKMIRVSPDCFIHPCSILNMPLIDLKSQSIDDYLIKYGHDFSKLSPPNSSICQDCNYINICDGCIAQGLNMSSKVDKCFWLEHTNPFFCNS